MKISFTLLYVLGALLVKNSVSAKISIFDRFSNGPHFDVEKQDDTAAFDESKNHLEEKNGVEALINSYKRSVDDEGSKRNNYESNVRKRSPYGLVYNQGKPIGILEPIPQSFEYSSYLPRDASSFRNSPYKSQWFPAKRELDFDLDGLEKDQLESQTSSLHSNNYADVLAKFKVNNKVKHRPYQDYLNSQTKRAASQDLSRRKEMEDLKQRGALDMGDLKTNLKKSKSGVAEESPIKEESNKVDEIEESLKDVMGEMGLVEKDKEAQAARDNQPAVKKREIYFEDEDLENGLNKIGLTKESHNDRNKKEDCPGKTKVAKSKGSRKFAVDKGLHKKGKKKARKDDDKRSIKSSRRRVAEKKDLGAAGESKMKVANYQYEGEEFIRRKRQEKEAEKSDDSEIMKGLETSGDLTVSGNKSPLVAVTNSEDGELKKSEEKRGKEELEYEKRLERNIQAKINAIKEEVKREIGKIQADDSKKDQQRKKREVATNTLLDEESSLLDPDLNIDQKLEPHIRKRRETMRESDAKSAKQKREISTRSNSGNANKKAHAKNRVSINKMVREATKVKDAAKEPASKASQKVKRSDPAADEVKRGGENEKPLSGKELVSKRDDRSVENIGTKVEKRGENRGIEILGNEGDADDLSVKNVEKREDAAIVATDKIETDNKAEFGTDAPGSIVKRNEHATSDENEGKDEGAISETASDVVKRYEKHLIEGTTDKYVDNSIEGKSVGSKSESNEEREDRSAANAISDIETGQTILEDDFETGDAREQRQSAENAGAKKSESVKADLDDKQSEEREERSVVGNKLSKARNVPGKQEKAAVSHKTLRRNSDSEKMEGDLITSSIAEANANEDHAVGKTSDVLIAQQSDAALNEVTKEENVDKVGVDSRGEMGDLVDEASPAIEERSVDSQKVEAQESDDGTNEGNSFEQEARKTFDKTAAVDGQDLNVEIDSLNNEMNDDVAVSGARRKRRARSRRYRNRHKRDESSYGENKAEMMNYRGDDGEVDEEDDETHDDGFDDQTANFNNQKRQADYDSAEDSFENNFDQEANEDYPSSYAERNKRNALRMYDDESDAEESYDNFLFYPNRYSRTKRHNYDDLAAVHGGGMTRHSAALRERGLQPYEQNLRRKRLEKMNRMHDPKKANVAELSEADIFGGFPQSYEGELSRFKRVKRSYSK